MRYIWIKAPALLWVLLSASFVVANSDYLTFRTAEEEKRYYQLIDEIRCPVCQGQSIGGSNSELATDLRQKTKALIEADKSDDEIITFMTERYGDFASFKPPLSLQTIILWLMPFVFALIAVLWLIRANIRARGNVTVSETQRANLAKAQALLAEDNGNNNK